MTIRAAIYARVSRPDEATILENQKEALRRYCESRGFELRPENEYFDVASGGTADRPGFNTLMERVAHPRLRTFDLVVFTSLSRMTRGGISAALDTLRVLEREKAAFHFVDQPILNLDSNTPGLARNIIMAVLAAVDEDYRLNISQKTKAAYARKKALSIANGVTVKWGRPKKRVPPVTPPVAGAPQIVPIYGGKR